MVEVPVVEEDDFLRAVHTRNPEIFLSKESWTVYVCNLCGCLFLGNIEGTLGFYPDRYEGVSDPDKMGCCTNCNCHGLRHMIDQNGQELNL